MEALALFTEQDQLIPTFPNLMTQRQLDALDILAAHALKGVDPAEATKDIHGYTADIWDAGLDHYPQGRFTLFFSPPVFVPGNFTKMLRFNTLDEAIKAMDEIIAKVLCQEGTTEEYRAYVEGNLATVPY